MNPDGSLDTSFNPPYLRFYDSAVLLVQPDQKILLGPGVLNPNGRTWLPVMRLNPNGSLDEAFSTNDTVIIGHSMVLQSNGKVIVDGLNRLPDGTMRCVIGMVDDEAGMGFFSTSIAATERPS